MRLILIFVISFMLWSCKSEQPKTLEKPNAEQKELNEHSKILLGNRMFSQKTCVLCHDVERYKKGPSIKEIMKVYKEEDGDIVSFLKGEAKPIVDTTPSQVAIMQENIDGFLKDISDEELNIIANYMMHVDELYP